MRPAPSPPPARAVGKRTQVRFACHSTRRQTDPLPKPLRASDCQAPRIRMSPVPSCPRISPAAFAFLQYSLNDTGVGSSFWRRLGQLQKGLDVGRARVFRGRDDPLRNKSLHARVIIVGRKRLRMATSRLRSVTTMNSLASTCRPYAERPFFNWDTLTCFIWPWQPRGNQRQAGCIGTSRLAPTA